MKLVVMVFAVILSTTAYAQNCGYCVDAYHRGVCVQDCRDAYKRAQKDYERTWEELTKHDTPADSPSPSFLRWQYELEQIQARQARPYEACGSQFERCRRQCQKGDGEACHHIGMIAKKGFFSFEEDFDLALTQFEMSCALNHGHGCRSLGFMLLHGQGVRLDTEKAMELYEKGCLLGDGGSCSNFASALVDANLNLDTRYHKDRYRLASRYFNKGCELGNAISCASRSVMYKNGWFVRKDLKKAHEILLDACVNLKLGSACHNAGYNFDPGNASNWRVTAYAPWMDELLTDPKKIYGVGCDLEDTASCQNLSAMQ